MLRVAFSWSHDEDLANDIVQEAVSKSLHKLHQLRDHDKLTSWIFGILSNCWRDHFRKLRDTVDIDEVVLQEKDTPERIKEREDIVSLVRSNVAGLPQGQRQVLTLVDLEGFSYLEVAEILDIPVGTVMSRLSRARRHLAETMLEYKSNILPFHTDRALRRIV
jgi:RNA polymerase sigma-70 factor (ECF subfamily)